MVTKNGVIKKQSLGDYQNIRVTGINAINIDEGDELLDVIRTDGKMRSLSQRATVWPYKFNETDASDGTLHGAFAV